MFKSYNVYIIILTDNDIAQIDRTVESALRQTYDRNQLRILIADNFSNDGTYERALQFAAENPDIVSAYRLKEKLRPARIMKKVSEFLKFSSVHFSTYVKPGDILYPEFIEKGVFLMHMSGGISAVYCNVDIFTSNGDIKTQIPIFTDDCFINKSVHYDLFFKAGVGNKVQILFRGMAPAVFENLIHVDKRTDMNDWQSQAFPNSGNIIYLRESMGCIHKIHRGGTVSEYMRKALSLKSQFFMTETNGCFDERNKKDLEEMEAAYRCIAMNALYEAIEEGLEKNWEVVRDCLIFAEMMFLDICNEILYKKIMAALEQGSSFEGLDEYKRDESIKPPKDCFIF